MPPPRRRRPVQPATRVRIPRTVRSRGIPGGESSGRLPVADAPETDLSRDDLAHDDRTRDDPTTDDLTGSEPAAQTLTRDAPTQDEPAEDEPTAGEQATDEATQDKPATDEAAAGKQPADKAAQDKPTAEEPTAGEQATDEAIQDKSATEEAAQDKPATDEATADEPASAAAQEIAPGPSRRPLLLPACLGALAVVLGALAVWFGLEASNATSGVDTSNTALTDPVATRQVTQQITSAVNKIFSYNYADTAATSQAAATLLTGKARQQYDTLFKLVRQDAPKEKLVLTTTVTNSGVEFLDGSQARLLIFADQRDTAGTAHKTTVAGAMFAVNAVNQGGRWKISSIDTFGAAG
jgi:Mce-associated membrane protein